MRQGAQAAYEIGRRHEATLTPAARELGAHYTPSHVAEGLTRLALDSWAGRSVPLIVDPTCGAGVFLVAAAEELTGRGVDATQALGTVRGVDSEPATVAAARRALSAWGEHHGVVDAGTLAADAVACGDGFELLDAVAATGGADLVVGNPPFGSQLRGTTVRTAAARTELSARFGTLARGYVDLAGLFLVAAVRSLAPGGVCALVQPRSLVAASHADGVRRAVRAVSELVAMWVPPDRVFDAGVHVCAPVVVAGEAAPVARERRVAVMEELGGTAVTSAVLAADAATWSTLLAVAQGVPPVDPAPGGSWPGAAVVADVAEVTAGFRDQYYALVDLVAEAPPPAPDGGLRLVTAGAIDIGSHGWGTRRQRFAKAGWDRPVVDRTALAAAPPAVRRWWSGLALPKVLVATQTRVVEAVADRRGDLVPVTPVVAAVPTSTCDVDHLVAALCAPPVAALAHHRVAGTGLSPTTLRLRAADVARLPLPVDATAWSTGVAELQAAVAGDEAAWARYATAATHAHGLGGRDDLVEWWLRRRGTRTRRPLPD